MMTKEEYERNLIRIWDSIRSDCKGKSGCTGVDCNFCPFNGKVCNLATNTIFNAYKSIEIVENWAKENPIKTNADKFEETFGFEAPMNRCITNNVSCSGCEYYEINGEYGICRADERFWNTEYKEPAESEVKG